MKHASVDRAKRIDSGCRNHGSCPYCRGSRTMSRRRVAVAVAMEQLDIQAETRGVDYAHWKAAVHDLMRLD